MIIERINLIKLPKLLLVAVILSNFACTTKKQEIPKDKKNRMETKKDKKQLRHVVLFKFKEESSKEDVEKLNAEFYSLSEKISIVKDFEWGINHSPENFHQDFTHCYLVTFESEKDRDSIYAPHPLHQKFVTNLGEHLEKVFVVDYWANK